MGYARKPSERHHHIPVIRAQAFVVFERHVSAHEYGDARDQLGIRE